MLTSLQTSSKEFGSVGILCPLHCLPENCRHAFLAISGTAYVCWLGLCGGPDAAVTISGLTPQDLRRKIITCLYWEKLDQQKSEWKSMNIEQRDSHYDPT